MVGVPVLLVRGVLMVTAVSLVAGATALAGAIAFIGLTVPHLTRAAAGTLWRVVSLPLAAVLGAALLVGCDALSQQVSAALVGADVSQRLGIPAGSTAAVLGAIALVVVARKVRVDP